MRDPLTQPDDGDMATEDDASLAAAALRSPDAFAALYDRYADRVYRYVHARVAAGQDAEDLVQTIFLQVLRALPRYDPARASFATWLFGIARHVVADAYRRRRPAVAWERVQEALQPVIEQDPAARLIRRDDMARLRALVSDLDADARELLALRFAARLTAAEIAAVIGATEAATKQRLARLVKSLRETYHDTAR